MSVVLVYGAGDDDTVSVARGAFKMMTRLKENNGETDGESRVLLQEHKLAVNKEVLQMVVEFCEHVYKFEGKQLAAGKQLSKAQSENLDVWKRKFCDDKHNRIFELLLAADDLGIASLVEVVGKAIGDTAAGKSVQQMRKQWGIVNDFTPEEEDHLRRENEWCEER